MTIRSWPKRKEKQQQPKKPDLCLGPSKSRSSLRALYSYVAVSISLSAITSLYSLRLYLGLYSKLRYSPVIIPISWISMGKIVNRNPSPRANRYNGGFMKRKSFLSFLSSFSLSLRLSRRYLLVSHGRDRRGSDARAGDDAHTLGNGLPYILRRILFKYFWPRKSQLQRRPRRKS